MLTRVTYKGKGYFAIGANERSKTLLLHDGSRVHVRDLTIENSDTQYWDEIFKDLPRMLAYCFERKARMQNGKVFIEMRNGQRMCSLQGSNPFIGVVECIRGAMNTEAKNGYEYNAEYHGPERMTSIAHFHESLIKGYQCDYIRMDVCDNVLLDAMLFICTPPIKRGSVGIISKEMDEGLFQYPDHPDNCTPSAN